MKFSKYYSRIEAGEILARLITNGYEELKDLMNKEKNQFFCYAIPNGGIPVAEGFCKALKLHYDFLIVRKIKIPFNTEAGFGSVTTDGTVLINEALLNRLNLTKNEVDDAIELTKREIRQRLKFYRKEGGLKESYIRNIQNKRVFMIDDGLASGFTMLAAIKMVKTYKPSNIYVAVPTAPQSTVLRIEHEVDEIICPNVRDTWRFAVAEAYANWYDVPESEVLELIKNSTYYRDN